MPLRVKPGQMRTPRELEPALIAPCGMNCGLCARYLRGKDRCSGCRAGDEGKAPSTLACPIRNCEMLQTSGSGFCSGCARLPCARLKRLDARYRAKYRMSMLGNLRFIDDAGIEAFVEYERGRWACEHCGGVQCVHTQVCVYCGHPYASLEE